MRRWLLIVAACIAVTVVAVPAALLYCAVFTEGGLRFIVSHIPQRIGGVRLEFVNARGTLAGGVRLDRLEIDQQRVHLRLEGIAARVELIPLLLQTVHCPDVSVRSVFVQVMRQTHRQPPSVPRFLPRWLIVRVDRAHVDDATLVVPNGYRLYGQQLEASGVARQHRIRLFQAAFTMDALHVSGTAEMRAADPLQLTGEVRATWQPRNQPAWIVAASASGDLKELPVTAHITTPFRADVSAEALALNGAWHWFGRANIADFDPTVWGGGRAFGTMTATLGLGGDANKITARGPIMASKFAPGAFDSVFEGSYANGIVTAKRLEITHRSSGAHALGSGTMAVVAGGPRFDMTGSWRNFRWPLAGAAAVVTSKSGDFRLAGIWPYQLHASGDLAVRNLDPMPVEIDATLAKNRLEIMTGTAAAFDGHANVSGAVQWSPSESWSLSGDVSGFNPGRLRPDLPGKLNFQFAATGAGFSGGNFELQMSGLGGTLRSLPASGEGKLAHRGSAWEFDQLRVGLGAARLALAGSLDKRVDLRFAVDADDLSLLGPESHGQLHAHGTFAGTLADPVVALAAHASGVRFAGWSLENLDASVDFDASGARHSQIDLHARNLAYGERRMASADFNLDGTAGDHVIHGEARAPGLALQLQATGEFAHGVWQGRLTQASANGNESLHLALESQASLLMSAAHLRVERLCLLGTPAKLCGEADWTPARWNAALEASDLPITTLTAGLTPSVDYRGQLSARARVAGAAQERATGSLRVDLVDASITHRLATGHVERITLGSGLVTVNASADSIEAQVGLDAGETGSIKGRATAARTTENWRDMPLKGELQAQTSELSYVTLYVPDIDRAAGRLEANLGLAGTVGTPVINGSVKLADAELDLYQVNLALRQTTLEAELKDNRLNFTGATHVGDGSARADGHFEWKNAQPYGKLHFEGTSLRVANIPEAQIDASPKLDFDIEGRRIAVSGTVDVPYASIVPADLAGAVRVSSDEVIVGAEVADPAERFLVTSNIKLTLGDKVSVETNGLSGKLTGNLTLQSDTDEVTRGAGELEIKNGKYLAYGRKLDIDHGRLIFNGGPINNPGVDIRAQKQYPDVIAGVNVRGTLLQPRLSFFSDPSLPQSQIVSLLLAGGSLESVQARQSGGGELLAQGGAMLAQELGARVGIQDVSLESDQAAASNTTDTSLVLGKYLSPRLYASYGVSLTEQFNTLKLRYTLTDRWTIKTEFGTANGADLVYTIQK